MKTLGIIGGSGWESSAAYYQRLNRDEEIGKLHAAGAQALLLGCTELPHAIAAQVPRQPLFSSTEPHVQAALDFMLETRR
jgi:aspartate/glutamate racemase